MLSSYSSSKTKSVGKLLVIRLKGTVSFAQRVINVKTEQNSGMNLI